MKFFVSFLIVAISSITQSHACQYGSVEASSIEIAAIASSNDVIKKVYDLNGERIENINYESGVYYVVANGCGFEARPIYSEEPPKAGEPFGCPEITSIQIGQTICQ